MPAALRSTARLTAEEVRAVRRLVDDATDADGHPPLSEHVLLHLPLGGDEQGQHLLAGPTVELAGYAHLDVTDPVAGPSAELVVAPLARRQGTGRALVEELLRRSPDGRLRLWAHGEHPAAAHLAAALGLRRSRVLLQMRRPLTGPLPPYAMPEGTRLRSFVVGQDEAAWTALNARAFAGHPEQGSWTEQEVLLREREPWFDPEGFLLAERDGALVGFHWTKVHGSDPSADRQSADRTHAHEAVGEVYVVGVDPAERGHGLGAALTVAGLHWLRGLGLSTVLLYVDEDNRAAVRVYERLGFVRHSTDVSFSRSPV